MIGDLISPFKAAIGLDYKSFELRLLGAIHVRFGLPANLPDAMTSHIKAADGIAAYYEATRLAGFEIAEARSFFGAPPLLPASLQSGLDSLAALPAAEVQRSFLIRFGALAVACDLK